jgi:hypothetical protein
VAPRVPGEAWAGRTWPEAERAMAEQWEQIERRALDLRRRAAGD